MPVQAPAAPAARLLQSQILESLGGLDLTSADGRAGIQTVLAEIERACPGAILQQAARIELGRLGWPPKRACQAAANGRLPVRRDCDPRSHGLALTGPPRATAHGDAPIISPPTRG